MRYFGFIKRSDAITSRGYYVFQDRLNADIKPVGTLKYSDSDNDTFVECYVFYINGVYVFAPNVRKEESYKTHWVFWKVPNATKYKWIKFGGV